ncbi:hypothetical protein ASD28_04990 [Massilia sp. Root133]|nr:hypothetical protein ASD28_04990 [Massilia sp. Root133]
MPDGLLRAALLGQLLRACVLGLLDTLLFGQLLRPLLLGLLDTLLFGQLLCPLLLGLLDTLLFGQLLRPLLLGLLDTLLFGQLLRPFLLGLLDTLLFGQLLRPLLLGLLKASLLRQAPLFLFLACPRLRFLGRALPGQRRLVLRGLLGETLALLLGLGPQPVLGVGAQAGFVRFAPQRPLLLAFLSQASALGPCGFLRHRIVLGGCIGLGRRLGAGHRVRRGIGLDSRQRHVERVVLMGFLSDHPRVQAIGQARGRRFAAAFDDAPRRRRGRGCRCPGHRYRHDGIDDRETVARYGRLLRRQRQRRHCRGRKCDWGGR